MHPAWQHPAVWHGRELFQRADWLWEFSPGELDELRSLAPEEAAESVPTIEHLPPCRFDTPNLRCKMTAIQAALENGSGAVLLRGFPLSEFDIETAAAIYWRLMQGVGTPVPQTAQGQRLFYVQDEGLAADHPQARGPSSRQGLTFHTDRCDVIGFLCVRAAREGGENQIVSSMALYNCLLRERPDLLQTLCQPYLYQRHNVDPGNRQAYYEQPVFSVCQGHFAASLMRVLIERAYASPDVGPMSNVQREALDWLGRVADRPEMQARLRQQPGDVLLLNNFVTLHRRDAFVDHAYGASKRLLLRVWLSVPNSRPLDPSFAASYGATDAGAIRGGMRSLAD